MRENRFFFCPHFLPRAPPRFCSVLLLVLTHISSSFIIRWLLCAVFLVKKKRISFARKAKLTSICLLTTLLLFHGLIGEGKDTREREWVRPLACFRFGAIRGLSQIDFAIAGQNGRTRSCATNSVRMEPFPAPREVKNHIFLPPNPPLPLRRSPQNSMFERIREAKLSLCIASSFFFFFPRFAINGTV